MEDKKTTTEILNGMPITEEDPPVPLGMYNSHNLSVLGTVLKPADTYDENPWVLSSDPIGAEYCSEKAVCACGADHTNDLKVMNANLRRHVP